MSGQNVTLHGRNHVPGGSDPIPGLVIEGDIGTYTDWALALPNVWGYWPLQEASGDAIDQGPTNADCDPVGTPAYQVAGPNSTDLPYAVRLTGAAQTSITDDSFFNTADDLEMDTRTEVTALCWIKPDSGAVGTSPLPILGTWDVFRTGWVLYLFENTRELTWVHGNGTNTSSLVGPVIPMDQWSLVGATYQAGEVKLYVDGSEVDSGTGLSHFTGAPANHGIRIGAVDFDNVGSDAYHFYGDMAGAIYVSEALSGAEMLEAYSLGASVTRRASIYTGTVVPDSSVGAAGDLFFDTATGDVYHKAAGGWTLLGAI